ncbi:(DL)-glycerol-3-phosphatase 2-like [Tripterygium wilfordii]|uniref:(DL)-glycerol-3-phosphatase 2-like n=1 Tax=Tripterygium wilfordii TaxID=458696 RepID=A0A7J7D9D1_TRIWF|nr:(DL)-glycerol-3-phosphatase 2-like [Tripterygium wilfordii]
MATLSAADSNREPVTHVIFDMDGLLLETGLSDSLSAEDFLVEREEMLQKMFPSSELMPGAGRLIKHLYAKGIPICVATGMAVQQLMKFSGSTGWLSGFMSVVMVPDPCLDSSYHTTADQVLSSLLNFNPKDWGLPPFDDPSS